MGHLLRLATKNDSESILNIYTPYIEKTAVSFEMEVPSITEFSNRVQNICAQYPYLVYQIEDEIIGFAYASKHRERSAYRYDVDVSIYVETQYHGSGIAGKLYGCLFELLKELGYRNAYAAFTVPNEKSRLFHEKFGFLLIGTHHKTGYKLGQWHDVTWLEKPLYTHNEKPAEIKSIVELSVESLNHVLNKNS